MLKLFILLNTVLSSKKTEFTLYIKVFFNDFKFKRGEKITMVIKPRWLNEVDFKSKKNDEVMFRATLKRAEQIISISEIKFFKGTLVFDIPKSGIYTIFYERFSQAPLDIEMILIKPKCRLCCLVCN